MKTRLIISTSVAAILISIVIIALDSENSLNENKVRIAYFPNIGHAIPIVGIEKGFFEASIGNTTKIETRVFDSGPQAIESLFANSIDVAYVGPGPAINGLAKRDSIA